MSAQFTGFPADPTEGCVIASESLCVAEAMAHAIQSCCRLAVAPVLDAPSLTEALGAAVPPRAAVVDFDLPGLGALSGALQLCADHAGCAIFIVTEVPMHYARSRLLGAGCAGVFNRKAPVAGLLRALAAVFPAEPRADAQPLPLPPRAGHLRLPPDAVMCAPVLTDIDRNVLRGLCEGLTNAAIADRLGLPVQTVQGTVRSLCARLGATNRTQAAMVALAAGLV